MPIKLTPVEIEAAENTPEILRLLAAYREVRHIDLESQGVTGDINLLRAKQLRDRADALDAEIGNPPSPS